MSHYLFANKREQFALNQKKHDREAILESNRKRTTTFQHEDRNVVRALTQAFASNNRKELRKAIKALKHISVVEAQLEQTVARVMLHLLALAPTQLDFALHNDILILSIRLTHRQDIPQCLYETIPHIVILMSYYMNESNQQIGCILIESSLTLLGNLAHQAPFLGYVTPQLIAVVSNIIEYGNRKTLEHALWALNQILYISKHTLALKKQALYQISEGTLPSSLARQVAKNKPVEKETKKLIYWLFFELSFFVSQEYLQVDVTEEKEEDLQLIILSYFSNLTQKQLVPFGCNPNDLIQIYYQSNTYQIKREVLVILSNLVQLIKIDNKYMRNLIFESMQYFQIDSVLLLRSSIQGMQIEVQSENEYNLLRQTLYAVDIESSMKEDLLRYFRIPPYNVQF